MSSQKQFKLFFDNKYTDAMAIGLLQQYKKPQQDQDQVKRTIVPLQKTNSLSTMFANVAPSNKPCSSCGKTLFNFISTQNN